MIFRSKKNKELKEDIETDRSGIWWVREQDDAEKYLGGHFKHEDWRKLTLEIRQLNQSLVFLRQELKGVDTIRDLELLDRKQIASEAELEK